MVSLKAEEPNSDFYVRMEKPLQAVTCHVLIGSLNDLARAAELFLYKFVKFVFVCRETSSRTRNTDLNFSFVIVYRAGTLVG